MAIFRRMLRWRPIRQVAMMKKRIKADRVSVMIAIATLTLVAAVALASPVFSLS